MRKAPTGIAGFDEITHGGLPHGRTSLVIGSSGSGKTVFALETLVNGALHYGESGIFIAFEESSTQVVENARSAESLLGPCRESSSRGVNPV